MASERVQRRINRLMDQLEEAVDQLDWTAARDLARVVLSLDPENSDAATFLAVAEQALGAPEAPPASEPGADPNQAPTRTSEDDGSFAGGRYRARALLGEGGRKQVYLAHDTLLDREVAFALIRTGGADDASRARVTREAQAMGRLGSHPHVVTIFDLGEHQGHPYIVTELMGGGSVEELLEQAPERRLSLAQVITIAQDTCRGLEFAHSRGIVHRDLKPGNVWLTAEGAAKIGDFGLALSPNHSRLTREGMMVGTLSYMPPEQAMSGQVSPRADLYSLGAMLYEMVTGRPPFLGDDSVTIIGQHINTPPVAPTWHNPQCPRGLETLILHLLAKNPSERPGSAAGVLRSLETIDTTTGTAKDYTPLQAVRSLDSLAGGVFVGRQREMEELKAALEEVLLGRGRLVTLVGEPGIGKTRTSQELTTYAGLRGAQVLWGRCHEEQGMPPYWPWVQAIRSYVREQDPGRLQSEMGAGAADIAGVVSEVRERLPDLKPLPASDSPEQARFRLFDSITTFLKMVSRRQPLMLVLENLHWADAPSLLLLEFLAQELGESRLLVVGTYRDIGLSRQHPLAQTLGELARERSFQRVLLRGLSREDVSRFIEVSSGVAHSSDLADAVYAETEGNPLFVNELVRHLVEEGDLNRQSFPALGGMPAVESGSFRIPEGVREVIGRRLSRLSDPCNEVLAVAAVVGREFEPGQLPQLVDDLSEEQQQELVEEALRARIIEELPGSAGRCQFTHSMIRQTLMEELSTIRRVRLHARIGEALEELYGDKAGAHAAELAHHFAEAATVVGGDKLAHYSLLAGERALAAYAYEDAVAHFQRGLMAGEGRPLDAETAALLAGLGRAQLATLERHRSEEAVASLRRAFDYYVEAGDVARAVAVVDYPFPYSGGHSTGWTELIPLALALVPPDSYEAGRILARYGKVLGAEEGNDSGAQDAFDRALAIARREGDLALEMRVLANAGEVDALHLRFPESLEKNLRVIELAQRLGDLHAEVGARFWAPASLMPMGDLESAESHASATLSAAERLHDRFWLSTALLCNQFMAQQKGDWHAARDLSDRALAASPTDARPLGARMMLEYQVGDYKQGQVYLERLLESVQRTPPGPNTTYGYAAMLIALVSRITGVADGTGVIGATAGAVLSSRSAVPIVTVTTRVGLGLVAARQGDSEEARQQYDRLKLAPSIVFPVSLTSLDRVRGILAAAMDSPDLAIGHFEDAQALCRRAGYRPELAWSLYDHADALLQRNGPGDRARVSTLLDEALDIAGELGMEPLAERAVSLQELSERQPGRAPQFPSGLTQREVSVLRLIATGKTNREIGEELIISTKTVDRHVSNIFAKTGVANRTEASMYATQQGLVQRPT